LGHFEQSNYPEKIPNLRVPLFRLGLLTTVLVSLLFQYLSETGFTSFLANLFTDLEYYAIISAILALWTSHKSSRQKNNAEPSEIEIRLKRQAII